MASSDNLMTMEQPWSFRPAFADAWVSDMFTKETDTLTEALQMSFASTSSDGDGGVFSPAGMVESIFVKPDAPPLQTPTGSGCSENEALAASAAVPKPRRTVPPSGGRVAKRKSRASKRAMTTFIAADAANFRQMVQQVTGVRFAGGLPAAVAATVRPEPNRVMSRLQMGGGLPTFDTSAFLLDAPASTMFSQPPTAATVAADGNGLDFDSFYSFPTLESWKV